MMCIYATHLDVVHAISKSNMRPGYRLLKKMAGPGTGSVHAAPPARAPEQEQRAGRRSLPLCTMRLSVSRLEPQPLGDDGWRLAARELSYLREVQREVDQRPQRVRGVAGPALGAQP